MVNKKLKFPYSSFWPGNPSEVLDGWELFMLRLLHVVNLLKLGSYVNMQVWYYKKSSSRDLIVNNSFDACKLVVTHWRGKKLYMPNSGNRTIFVKCEPTSAVGSRPIYWYGSESRKKFWIQKIHRFNIKASDQRHICAKKSWRTAANIGVVATAVSDEGWVTVIDLAAATVEEKLGQCSCPQGGHCPELVHCRLDLTSQRIFICKRTDSTPLRLTNICLPNLSPRLLCQTVR